MKKLVSTLGLDHAEWLRYRKNGIGGSDAGAVCGLHPYSSPMKVYYDKTSDETGDPDNESMRQGRDLEEYVARRFCEETGFKVRKANGIYYDEERPFMLADADRLIVGQRAGLECKTVSPYSAERWSDGKIPLHYQVQCYHYMSVFRMDTWYIAALVLGKDFIIRKITWDDSVIQDLRQIEGDFWKNHVEKRILPQPDGSEVSEKLILEAFGKAEPGNVVPLSGFSEKLVRRKELTELIEKMDTEKKQIEQELKLYIGNAEGAEGEGYRVSWKNVVTNRVDSERLKQEKPEVYRAYLKPTNSRRLLVKVA